MLLLHKMEKEAKSSALHHVNWNFSVDFSRSQAGSQRHQKNINPNQPLTGSQQTLTTQSVWNFVSWKYTNILFIKSNELCCHISPGRYELLLFKDRTQQAKHKPYFIQSIEQKLHIYCPLLNFTIWVKNTLRALKKGSQTCAYSDLFFSAALDHLYISTHQNM